MCLDRRSEVHSPNHMHGAQRRGDRVVRESAEADMASSPAISVCFCRCRALYKKVLPFWYRPCTRLRTRAHISYLPTFPIVFTELHARMASFEHLDPYITPAMKPPDGQLPNFVNPETMHGWLVATAVICLTISGLSIILRTYVKAVLLRKIVIEDCTLIRSTSGDNFCMTKSKTVKLTPHRWQTPHLLRRRFCCLRWPCNR